MRSLQGVARPAHRMTATDSHASFPTLEVSAAPNPSGLVSD